MKDVPWQVHTNIVVFKLKHKSSTAVFGFVKALQEQGVLVLPFRFALLSLCMAYRCLDDSGAYISASPQNILGKLKTVGDNFILCPFQVAVLGSELSLSI